MARKNEGRDRICQAMVELLLQKGIDDITIKELVSRANVNRTSFYYYFEDLDDVVDLIVRSFTDGYFETTWTESFSGRESGGQEDMHEIARDSHRRSVDYLYGHREVCYLIVKHGYHKRFIDRYIELVDKNLSSLLFKISLFGGGSAPLSPGVRFDYVPYQTAYLNMATIDFLTHRNFADDSQTVAEALLRVASESFTGFERSPIG